VVRSSVCLAFTWPSYIIAGLPSPDYFPFTSVSADVLPTDAFPLDASRGTSSAYSPFGWFWRLFGTGKDDTTCVQIPREPHQGDEGLNLATALQYGPATGMTRTQAFIREFTERIYAPAYSDWTTLVHAGNTDGCGLFCPLWACTTCLGSC
jgi:aromatic amino acid aminotransferase I